MSLAEEIMFAALQLIAKRTNGGDTREAMVTRKIARDAIARCEDIGARKDER